MDLSACRAAYHPLPQEPAALTALRDEALARFEDLGPPTSKLEDWKYSNPRNIARGVWAPHPVDLDAATVAPFRLAGAGVELVFVNGRFAPHLSNVADHAQGVSVLPLSGSFREQEGLVALLGGIARADGPAEAFTALNAAFLQDGAVVHLEAGAAFERPIHVLHLAVGRGGAALCQPRTLVHLDAGAVASLVETQVGLDGESFTNAVTELYLASGASLQHTTVHRSGSDAAAVVNRTRVSIASEADYHHVGLWLGGGWVRHDVDTRFDGEGGRCSLDGLIVAHGDAHVDAHTAIDHAVPRCTSRELYKSVLGAGGKAVFNGKVLMRRGAVGSDADQANHNLLLAPDADIYTKPQLEIFNDEVAAAHGTTVGQLDETALFYLRSRGIGATEARRMLVSGFAREVVERIADEGLRERAAVWVEEALAAAEEAG